MSDIRITRFGQFLKRLTANFGATQGGTLVDDIMPVAPIYDVQHAEFAWMRDEGIGVCSISQPAVAAQWSSVALSNDSPDGLLVVENVQSIGGAGVFVAVQKGTPVAALGMVLSARVPVLTDTRWSTPVAAPRDAPVSAKIARLYTRANVLQGVVIEEMQIPGALNWQIPCPVILGPGWYLLVEGTAVNQAVTVNFVFHERANLDLGELR